MLSSWIFRSYVEFERSLGDLSPAFSYSFRVQIPSVPFHSLKKVGQKERAPFGSVLEYLWPILKHVFHTVCRSILGTNIGTNKQDISISLYLSASG